MNLDLQFWHYGLFFGIGILVSFINSLAGGGSVFSVPLFIFLGMPGAQAHGTNRAGVIWGSLSSVGVLWKKGHLRWDLVRAVIVPSALGAIAGSFIALELPDKYFNPLLAIVILIVVFATDIKPPVYSGEVASKRLKPWAAPLVYILVGVYGGFIQIGMGLVMMFMFSRVLSLNILQVNALKSAAASIYLIISVVIFTIKGHVFWPLVLVFALGNYLGGLLGGNWQIKKSEAWIRWVVRLMGIIIAGRLLWISLG